MPLDDFMQARIFEPLGMTDTVFWVDPARADRLAPVYRPSSGGDLQPHMIEPVPFTDRPALIEGGVGLVSSVADYVRFSQMFLNEGKLDGRRVLRPETVTLMTVNRIPDALRPIGFGLPTPGRGWTLGFSVVMDPDAFPLPVSEGTFWWDGSAGTRFFIDPVQHMVIVIMAQVSPAGGNGFRETFTTLVDEAIVERRVATDGDGGHEGR